MTVEVCKNALADLGRIRAANPRAAAAIAVLLEQLQVDPRIIQVVTIHGETRVGQQRVSIKYWRATKNEGDFRRIRILDSPASGHRIFFAYDWRARYLCVLAIAAYTDITYDDLSSSFCQRILTDWARLGS